MNAPMFDANAYVAEIEQNVLGSLMFGGDSAETLAILHEHHFVQKYHQVIYRAIRAARDRYNLCNPILVKKLIPEDQAADFEKVIGRKLPEYLAHLMSSATVGAAGSVENARKIIEQWARLALANEAGRIYAAANDPMADVRIIAHDAAKTIDDVMAEVRSGGKRKSRVSIASAAMQAVTSAAEAKQSGSGLTGITWGLADLNRMTGGIQRRDLTLIGARPSMGKTTVALSVAIDAAKAGVCCGIVSLEMDAEKLAARAISNVLYDWRGAIPYGDIIRGDVTDEQLDLIVSAQEKFNRLPIIIDDQSGQTVTDIRTRAERMLEDSRTDGNPMSVLFIDHLGLIRPSSRYSGNRVNEIAEVTSGLKSLARELDIAVVLLSQLNRALESREEKRPMLSDLRDSGAIEQDADMIAFLFRESYYLERATGGAQEEQMVREDRLDQCRNSLEFIIAKQRNGPLGTVHLFADMAYSAVRNGARQ
ncbi:replicative DNA helicase [Sinorhizobium meliloti]|uniref:replicative DNA helicase n=1 Tax=Rhizobium meliloti TaxID=382 RepID=UPI00037CCDB5|nr:DnaB-like helicase C-terminal domain-containing protein [Sinorhizobium meliloti]